MKNRSLALGLGRARNSPRQVYVKPRSAAGRALDFDPSTMSGDDAVD